MESPKTNHELDSNTLRDLNHSVFCSNQSAVLDSFSDSQVISSVSIVMTCESVNGYDQLLGAS